MPTLLYKLLLNCPKSILWGQVSVAPYLCVPHLFLICCQEKEDPIIGGAGGKGLVSDDGRRRMKRRRTLMEGVWWKKLSGFILLFQSNSFVFLLLDSCRSLSSFFGRRAASIRLMPLLELKSRCSLFCRRRNDCSLEGWSTIRSGGSTIDGRRTSFWRGQLPLLSADLALTRVRPWAASFLSTYIGAEMTTRRSPKGLV